MTQHGRLSNTILLLLLLALLLLPAQAGLASPKRWIAH